MRIRSIKPEFWRSMDISSLDNWIDRFIFIGLWSYVDDNGVGIDRLSLITTDLFADDVERDPRETFARVSRGLQNLSEAGLIVRYSVAERSFLYITNWSKHQRIDKPNKSRYPDPTCDDAEIRESVARVSRESPEIPAPGTGEQGSSGTGEQRSRSSSSAMPPREDVDSLCSHLLDKITGNGGKATITEKWRNEARLLLDADKVELDVAHRLIDWCQDDPFWHTNILSMTKFRQQYQQLLLKARAQQRERPPGRTATGLTPREMEIARAELLKENPNQALLEHAGLGQSNHLRAIEGGAM